MFDQKYRHFTRFVFFVVLACLSLLSLFPNLIPAAADTLAAGLRGEYFDNEDFTTLKLTRTDATVDFNWGFDSPSPNINSETFSIRWTGQLTPPTTGNYVLVTQSDDGVRLWLGDQLLIDNVVPHPVTEDRSAAITLTAGQSYNLRLEYFELTANAIIRLLWIRPGQTSPEIIPAANLATPVNPNSAPTLASLSPSIIPLGSPNMMLTVNGSNFLPGAVVQINNAARPTTVVSSSQVTATMTANDLAIATQSKITVVNPLPGGGTSNPLTLTISGGFEGDVAPRPNGSNNGTITIADWTQLGRFAAGLDAVTVGAEYQRADCAPRSSLGDGRITLTDWVQAGRYAAALDPVTGAGGPTAPAMNLQEPSEEKIGIGSRKLGIDVQNWRVAFLPPADQQSLPAAEANIFTVQQSPKAIAIFCEGAGIENAVSFSLRFDADQWELLSYTPGNELRDATFLVNDKLNSAGLIGVALALPPNRHLNASHHQIAVLTFRNRLGNIAPSFSPLAIEFVDQPIAREVASNQAQQLKATFTSGFQSTRIARLAGVQPRRQ
ncbi:MAG: hypothetical protein JST85_27650 [Acidobacteria bacterium]|nr:hypothetical protein [Acidobacteriota bacterium]